MNRANRPRLSRISGSSYASRAMSRAGDGSTLSLDFTTGVLDSRLTFTRSTTGTYINSSGYVTSAAINAPRFDYDPTTLAPRGLLIEGSATNLVTQSNGSTSVWGTGGNRTPTNNTTDLVSPDGTNNATKLVCGAAGNYASFATSISGLTGGATYTISYWIRGPVGHSPRLYAQNGTTGDVTATATTGTYNNTGWTRLTQTYTLPATTTQVLVYFMSTNIVTTGDTFYVYGFQMETGSGASSHIPTGASQGSRAADSCVMTGANFSSWFNASAGTIFVNYGARISTGSNRVYTFASTDSTNQIFENIGNGTALNVFSSSSFVAQIGNTWNTAAKYAAAYSVNDYAVSVAGSNAATDTLGALPVSIAKLIIGDSNAGTVANNGPIASFKYWPTRLSNAQLQSLTT